MNDSSHHPTSRAASACQRRRCCTSRAARAAGVPFCTLLCVCVVCSRSARAQDEVQAPPASSQSTAPDGPTQEATDGEPGREEDVPPDEDRPSEEDPSEEEDVPPEEDRPSEESTLAITPPRVVESSEALYPDGAWKEGREATVTLLVTVLEDGSVGAVEVATSAGRAFDEAAVIAVRKWRFEPAYRGTIAVQSRIQVPFRFKIPPRAVSPEKVEAQSLDPSRKNAAQTDASSKEGIAEVVVHGERELRTEKRSSSDFLLDRGVLAAAPHREGADVLRTAPGIYIGRAEGPAVAHNYMLRGFDADHGQDIEFRVGGLPINLPSHIHGQGYADLGFLIGDTVQELRVIEGVSDPRQGDFAVAGSVDLTLGVAEEDRGVGIRSGYGSFNSFRQQIFWAPRNAPEETFGAVQYMRTDGFGENRAGQSGSGIFQHRFGEGDVTYRAIGVLHAARSDLAGVVRTDDVESGRVCRECVYPYPTARAQNAQAGRFLAGLFADYSDEDGANGQFGAWIGYDNFRLQENFTGFVQESRTLERVGGLGDLIEQQNRTFSLGLTGRYRTSSYRPTRWMHGTVELGADGRLDSVEQSQNLLDAAARNQTWDRRIDASVRGIDIGFWGDLDWCLSRYVNYRLGLRADVLSYDVDDRLGNYAPQSRPQDSYHVGFRRSALGAAWGPRTSVRILPIHWLSILASYGEGYRSPQARLLEDGEKAPFSKVRAADAGMVFDAGDPMRLTIGWYYTHLSDDVAFDASEGRLERIGATRRLGAVSHVISRPLPWLLGSVSFTFVDATLLEPPPPTADEPQPPFEDGQNLPYVPPIVIRADIGAKHTFVERLGGQPLGGRIGSGFSYLSARPLPYGDFADPVALLDAVAGVSWGPAQLTFEIFNLLNAQYAALEYSFPSDWDPNDGLRSRVPARHTSAGAPLSWMLSLGLTI